VGIAASTIAEKLSVYCEGSGRLAFGAALWIAVLAGMSDETLNTWEPFAIETQPPRVQQGPGQTPRRDFYEATSNS
jgi:hypothetical protein